MPDREPTLKGLEAHDELFSDIARAKNKGVYFESADSDTQMFVGRVDDEDRHAHYVGFRNKVTKDPYLILKFDCLDYHRFSDEIAAHDSLGFIGDIAGLFGALGMLPDEPDSSN